MGAREYTPAPKGGLSNAQKIARRDAGTERIRALLAERAMTVTDLAVELRQSQGTTYAYLRYLAEMDEVHRTDAVDVHQRKMWALGPDESNVAEVETKEKFQGAVIVPARQLGIPRDPLVAALFGPARGAVS
jgi:hypothetical protein